MTTTSTTADPMPELADMSDLDAYLASIEAQSAWGRRQLAKHSATPVVAGKPQSAPALVRPVRLGDRRVMGVSDRHAPSNRLDAVAAPVLHDADGFATYRGRA